MIYNVDAISFKTCTLRSVNIVSGILSQKRYSKTKVTIKKKKKSFPHQKVKHFIRINYK